MTETEQSSTQVALWLIAFLFCWPIVAGLGLVAFLLTGATEVGSAVAAAVQAASVTAAAWFISLYAFRRGAPKAIWIPILIASLYPALEPATISLAGFGAYRLLWPDTYLLIPCLLLTAFGPAIASHRAFRRSGAFSDEPAGTALGTQQARPDDGQER